MKVGNLLDYPAQLADGRVIGAAGTPEAVREYGAETLADADKKRVERGWLAVVVEKTIAPVAVAVVEDKTEEKTTDTKKGATK